VGFFDSWLERAISERMPATLCADPLGELGPVFPANPANPMSYPAEGWMHVVCCTALNRDATRAACHMTYVIQADGVRPFSGDQVFELGGGQRPNPCDDLPVIFDRNNTEHIQIQWDRLPTHAECLKQQINSSFCQPSDRDIIWRLERLGRLRDTALITADEFAIHKRRILAENADDCGGRSLLDSSLVPRSLSSAR
jgi:hypothetical protein